MITCVVGVCDGGVCVLDSPIPGCCGCSVSSPQGAVSRIHARAPSPSSAMRPSSPWSPHRRRTRNHAAVPVAVVSMEPRNSTRVPEHRSITSLSPRTTRANRSVHKPWKKCQGHHTVPAVQFTQKHIQMEALGCISAPYWPKLAQDLWWLQTQEPTCLGPIKFTILTGFNKTVIIIFITPTLLLLYRVALCSPA